MPRRRQKVVVYKWQPKVDKRTSLQKDESLDMNQGMPERTSDQASSSNGQSACAQYSSSGTYKTHISSTEPFSYDGVGSYNKGSEGSGRTDPKDHHRQAPVYMDDTWEDSAYFASGSANGSADDSANEGCDLGSPLSHIREHRIPDAGNPKSAQSQEHGGAHLDGIYVVLQNMRNERSQELRETGLITQWQKAQDERGQDERRQDERRQEERARELRVMLATTKSKVHFLEAQLREMQEERRQDEQERKLRDMLTSTKLKVLSLQAQLQKTRDEQKRALQDEPEWKLREALAKAKANVLRLEAALADAGVGTRVPEGADEVRREMEQWFRERGQIQAVAPHVRREALSRQGASPSQSSARVLSGQRLRLQGASAPSNTIPMACRTAWNATASSTCDTAASAGSAGRGVREMSYGEVNLQIGDADQLPRRKRPLHPLPRLARTLVVRNVPWAYNQEDLLVEWLIDGDFDYFHLPYHFLNERPLGYAYINFVSYEAAVAFQERWQGRYLLRQGNKNSLDITVAKIQGRGPNLARIEEERIPILAAVNFLPVLLDGRRRMDTHEVIAEIYQSRLASERLASVQCYQ